MADPRVFLCLGGGDAIDTAAKLARQYWAAQGQPERMHLISRTFAYHGTHGFGTSLVGMESMRQGYGPLLGSVSHVDHQSPEALEAEIERVGAENVAAFFCEPVIGAGGVRPAPEGYIEAVAAICKRHGVLLVIDSVICAFGRVGTWFGYERWDIEPDMVVLAKGITSGYLPLGGVIVSGAVAEPFWAGRAGRCSATGRPTPAIPPAARPRSPTSRSSSARAWSRAAASSRASSWTSSRRSPTTRPCGEIRGGLGLAAAVDLTPEALASVPGAIGRYAGAIREAGVLLRAAGHRRRDRPAADGRARAPGRDRDRGARRARRRRGCLDASPSSVYGQGSPLLRRSLPMDAAPPTMPRRKQLALIAHDNRKADMLEWARYNRGTLAQHELHATGTTGAKLASELGLDVHRFLSGPLGGDQQVGAAIAEGRIDFVIFFWDPLEPHPHDVDVKALLRIAVVYNVPIACNRATADFVLSSPLMGEEYHRVPTA